MLRVVTKSEYAAGSPLYYDHVMEIPIIPTSFRGSSDSRERFFLPCASSPLRSFVYPPAMSNGQAANKRQI